MPNVRRTSVRPRSRAARRSTTPPGAAPELVKLRELSLVGPVLGGKINEIVTKSADGTIRKALRLRCRRGKRVDVEDRGGRACLDLEAVATLSPLDLPRAPFTWGLRDRERHVTGGAGQSIDLVRDKPGAVCDAIEHRRRREHAPHQLGALDQRGDLGVRQRDGPRSTELASRSRRASSRPQAASRHCGER